MGIIGLLVILVSAAVTVGVVALGAVVATALVRPWVRDAVRPLHLRSEHGGIQLDGTTAVADPRVQLVGYGPSASTIGANRAGRVAARGVARWLAETREDVTSAPRAG